MGLASRVLYEASKKVYEKGEDALSDPAFEALAESWNEYFSDTELDTDDFFLVFTDEEVKKEIERFERQGRFNKSVIAERIERVYNDYNPSLEIDGLKVAEEIVYRSEPKLPGDTQQKIQTRLTRRILSLKEESKRDKGSLRLKEDLNYEKSEEIFSNIFQLDSKPRKVFYGETGFRNLSDVYSEFGQDIPPFILKEGRIYSFANLRGTKLAKSVKGEIKSTDLKSWVEKHGVNWLLYLMNRYLGDYLWELGLRKRDNDLYFYPSDESRVEANWNFPVKKSNRWIVKYEGGYFRHKALRIRFRQLGDQIFLVIKPRECISRDGYHDVDQKTKNRVKSSGQNFNRNYQQLNDLRFWTQYLGQNSDEINLGNGLRVSMTPIQETMAFRREQDYRAKEKPFASSKVELEEIEVDTD